MPWLKISEGECVHATIDFSSIKTVVKHWTGQRSELCLGEGCPHCLAGNPKRWRYQARLIVDKTPSQWEFGDQVQRDLQAIPHDTNWGHITITRTGEGRRTRYDITSRLREEAPRAPSYAQIAARQAEQIIRRKYGDTYEAED